MKALLLIACLTLLSGCWVDSLIGDKDDQEDYQPAHYYAEPNPPVVVKP